MTAVEELAAVLVQLEVAEELAAHAGHALAEAEEADPPDARAVERCRDALAVAEARLDELRQRRRGLEARGGGGRRHGPWMVRLRRLRHRLHAATAGAGPQYRRPANGTRRAPAADGGAFHEDDLTDIGR